AYAAEHRELRELPHRSGARHADVDRHRDAFRIRRRLPVRERRRVEAELRREVQLERRGLRELRLAVQRLLDTLLADGLAALGVTRDADLLEAVLREQARLQDLEARVETGLL